MNKKDAVRKARQGVTAGDLTAILNDAQDQAVSYVPSKLNRNLHKRRVWSMMISAISAYPINGIVDVDIAANILREFAPGELKEAKPFCDVNSIPF